MGFQSSVHTTHEFSPVKCASTKETVGYPIIIVPLLLQYHSQFLFIFPHVLTSSFMPTRCYHHVTNANLIVKGCVNQIGVSNLSY